MLWRRNTLPIPCLTRCWEWFTRRAGLRRGAGGFAKALELNPTYLPAIANLARLDIAEKKPADARKRFEAVIAKDPKNEQALLALADVMARTGAPPAEIVATLQRAVTAILNPSRRDWH